MKKKDTYFESVDVKQTSAVKQNQCPPVDAALVEFLDKRFPNQCPSRLAAPKPWRQRQGRMACVFKLIQPFPPSYLKSSFLLYEISLTHLNALQASSTSRMASRTS